MKSVVLQHPWLCLILALLTGMIVEWFLEMFFFRRRLNDAESGLHQSERDLSDTKFALSRTQTELRSKHDLLEATQKSKTANEATLQARERELGDLRTRLAGAEQSVSAAEERIVELAAAARAGVSDSDRAVREHEQLKSEAAELRSAIESVRLGEATTEARLATESAAATELRGALALREEESNRLIRRVEELEATLAAQSSVTTSLQAAVLARDKAVNDSRAQTAGIEAERESVARALAAADAQLAALKAQGPAGSGTRVPAGAVPTQAGPEIAALNVEIAELKGKLGKTQKDTSAAKARASAPSTSPETEKEIAALRERTSQLQDNLSAAAATRKELERELGEREQEAAEARVRARKLEDELQAARKAKSATGSPAPSTGKSPGAEAKLETLVAELEAMGRERNELAAELAALKAAQPAPAKRSRSATSTDAEG